QALGSGRRRRVHDVVPHVAEVRGHGPAAGRRVRLLADGPEQVVERRLAERLGGGAVAAVDVEAMVRGEAGGTARDADRLVSRSGDLEEDLVLPLQAHLAVVDASRGHHGAVEAEELIGGEASQIPCGDLLFGRRHGLRGLGGRRRETGPKIAPRAWSGSAPAGGPRPRPGARPDQLPPGSSSPRPSSSISAATSSGRVTGNRQAYPRHTYAAGRPSTRPRPSSRGTSGADAPGARPTIVRFGRKRACAARTRARVAASSGSPTIATSTG